MKALIYSTGEYEDYIEEILFVDENQIVDKKLKQYKEHLQYLENRAKKFNEKYVLYPVTDILQKYFDKLQYPLSIDYNGIQLFTINIINCEQFESKIKRNQLIYNSRISAIERFYFDVRKANKYILEEIYNLLIKYGYKLYEQDKGYKEVFNTLDDVYNYFTFDTEGNEWVLMSNKNSTLIQITPQEFLSKLKR